VKLAKSPFVFDLFKHLRSDARKNKLINETLAQMVALEAAKAEGQPTFLEMRQKMTEMVNLCGFNFGLLLPYIFPKYIKGRPLDLVSRPFMFALTCLAGNSIVVLRAGRQIGKCVCGDTVLKTNKGEMTIEKLYESAV